MGLLRQLRPAREHEEGVAAALKRQPVEFATGTSVCEAALRGTRPAAIFCPPPAATFSTQLRAGFSFALSLGWWADRDLRLVSPITSALFVVTAKAMTVTTAVATETSAMLARTAHRRNALDVCFRMRQADRTRNFRGVPMLTLYFSPGACSLASHIGIEETGAPYEASHGSRQGGSAHPRVPRD